MRQKKIKQSIAEKQTSILAHRTTSSAAFLHTYVLQGGVLCVRDGLLPLRTKGGELVNAGTRLRLTHECAKELKSSQNPGLNTVYDFMRISDNSPVFSASMSDMREWLITESEGKSRLFRVQALQTAAAVLLPRQDLSSGKKIWRPTSVIKAEPATPVAPALATAYDKECILRCTLHEVRGILSPNIGDTAVCARAVELITKKLAELYK